jgi:hypothetical protein
MHGVRNVQGALPQIRGTEEVKKQILGSNTVEYPFKRAAFARYVSFSLCFVTGPRVGRGKQQIGGAVVHLCTLFYVISTQ